MSDKGILGLSSFLEQLDQLGKVGGLKVLASAARSAVRPLVDRAKELAPNDTGELADSIGLSVQKPARAVLLFGDNAAVSAGIKMKARKIENEITGDLITRDASYRWHLSEYGVPARGIPAHSYLRAAFDATKGQMIEIFKTKLAAAIRRAMKKQNPDEAAG